MIARDYGGAFMGHEAGHSLGMPHKDDTENDRGGSLMEGIPGLPNGSHVASRVRLGLRRYLTDDLNWLRIHSYPRRGPRE